jgi:hypothetical protein
MHLHHAQLALFRPSRCRGPGAATPSNPQGVALRCVACKALLINAQGYRAHAQSKVCAASGGAPPRDPPAPAPTQVHVGTPRLADGAGRADTRTIARAAPRAHPRAWKRPRPRTHAAPRLHAHSRQHPLPTLPHEQKHIGAMRSWPEHLGPAIVFATDAAKGEETGETHGERLARLRRQAELDAQDAAGGSEGGGAAGRSVQQGSRKAWGRARARAGLPLERWHWCGQTRARPSPLVRAFVR